MTTYYPTLGDVAEATRNVDEFVLKIVRQALAENNIEYFQADDGEWIACIRSQHEIANYPGIGYEVFRMKYTPDKIVYTPHTVVIYCNIIASISYKTHKWLIKKFSEHQIMQKLEDND